MKYKSTRGNRLFSSSHALLYGMPEDGGLYIPDSIPNINITYDQIKNLTYQQLAQRIIELFFTDLPREAILNAVNNAYNNDTFTTPNIVPLHKLNNHLSLGELFHGRTLAFKDLALSLFPYLLLESKKVQGENKKTLILTATSGDTGKAALEGFKDIDNINILVFYPKNGVSPMQEEQMRKQLGNNVEVVAIDGNFDDAQSAIKEIFNSEEYHNIAAENNIMFSSANSINIGRLFPQVIYYIWTYINLVKSNTIKENEKFNVVVPTGNFGNILAGFIAKKLGIPIEKFISASNENNVLSDFFKNGIYNKNREFHITNSPSMDILLSSNFERYLYYALGENENRIKELMESLNKTGILKITENELKEIQQEFVGEYATEQETINAISKVYNEYRYLMDPHTAVGYTVYEKLKNEINKELHTVIMATAHPFKFPLAISKALDIKEDEPYSNLENISNNFEINFPTKLSEIKDLKFRFSNVIPKEEIGNFIKSYIKKIK